MTKDYVLKPGEALLLKEEDVSAESAALSGTGTLILTSEALVFMKEAGFFRTKTEEYVFPLAAIMTHDGKAQVFLTKSDMENRLELYTDNGKLLKFTFGEGLLKCRPQKWADAICGAISKKAQPVKNKAAYVLPGADTVAKYAVGTIHAFIDAFKGEPRKAVIKCTGCGASVEVTERTITECPYCNTKIAYR